MSATRKFKKIEVVLAGCRAPRAQARCAEIGKDVGQTLVATRQYCLYLAPGRALQLGTYSLSR